MPGSATVRSSTSADDQIVMVRAQRYAAAATQQAYLDQRRRAWTPGVDRFSVYIRYRPVSGP